ncbi:DUF3718 domain-containing protein [Aestuariibacter salexigens]|uniref:DUF3718 domain-containing protein n=1 Tax=Aestuariibacter salexigens TaxID=226010 RepID=UPI000552DAB8|nr:DUF3718 domain-containing protein [Aestuariibacter salexigens]
MKKAIFIATMAATLGFASLSSAVNAATYDKEMEEDLINVCEALSSNSKLRLHLAVKKSRVSYQELGRGLVCNGQDAVTFASLNGADITASLLAKRAGLTVDGVLAKR